MTTLKLDRRERIGLLLSLLLLLFIIGLLLYVPRGPRQRYLDSIRDLSAMRDEYRLAAMAQLDAETQIQGQKVLMEKLDSRPPNFDLFASVNNFLRELDLMERAQLENYRPRNTSPLQPMVRLKLSHVTLKELLDFLHKIYAGNNVIAVYQLDRLQPAANRKGIDCDITLVTIKT
jgi:hypothetical protein